MSQPTFDDLFTGRQRPSFSIDYSYLVQPHAERPEVKIDYEAAEEYTLRRFSTCSKGNQLIDEGGERRKSRSHDEDSVLHTCFVMGSSDVGKSSICSQFLSCDHNTGYNLLPSFDSKEHVVGVQVDTEKCRFVFVELDSEQTTNHFEEEINYKMDNLGISHDLMTKPSDPTFYLVVFGVDKRHSLEKAGKILADIRKIDGLGQNHISMLIANKADLVRSREVTEEEGKTLAERYRCLYMETSSGLNYNMDQLLVRLTRESEAMKESGKDVRKISMKEKVKGLVARRPQSSRDTSPNLGCRDTSPRQKIRDNSQGLKSRDASPRMKSSDPSPRLKSRDASPRLKSRDASPKRSGM